MLYDVLDFLVDAALPIGLVLCVLLGLGFVTLVIAAEWRLIWYVVTL